MYEFTFSNLWVWSEFLLNSLMISPSAIKDERSGLKMEINSTFEYCLKLHLFLFKLYICNTLLNHKITGFGGLIWMSVHYLKIEVIKYICSLSRIFKIARQTQQFRDSIMEYKWLYAFIILALIDYYRIFFNFSILILFNFRWYLIATEP